MIKKTAELLVRRTEGASAVLLLCSVFIFSIIECRAQDISVPLGFISYSKYKGFNEFKKNKELAALKEAGALPVMIPQDDDIFLPENEQEIKKYKRIWIPGYAYVFPEKTYDGMKKYVEGGGLLITCDSLILAGTDSDPKPKFKENPVVGASGQGGASYDKIMITVQCPLTEGFVLNQWVDIKAAGRQVSRTSSAVTVAVAHGTSKLFPSFETPFLMYNQLGSGACIYLVGAENGKLIKNILSESTLRWLCM